MCKSMGVSGGGCTSRTGRCSAASQFITYHKTYKCGRMVTAKKPGSVVIPLLVLTAFSSLQHSSPWVGAAPVGAASPADCYTGVGYGDGSVSYNVTFHTFTFTRLTRTSSAIFSILEACNVLSTVHVRVPVRPYGWARVRSRVSLCSLLYAVRAVPVYVCLLTNSAAFFPSLHLCMCPSVYLCAKVIDIAYADCATPCLRAAKLFKRF